MTEQNWTIDNTHSSVNFFVRHMMFSKVRGQFTKWSSTVKLDEADLTKLSVEVVLDAASIDTGVAERDNHLRSPDFFDVERFPEIRFVSRRVEQNDETHFKLIGDLTIKDVTREVVLEAEDEGRGKDPWGNQRAGFNLRATLNRKDFGLAWNQVLEAGGVLVGEAVELTIELQLVQNANQQVA